MSMNIKLPTSISTFLNLKSSNSWIPIHTKNKSDRKWKVILMEKKRTQHEGGKNSFSLRPNYSSLFYMFRNNIGIFIRWTEKKVENKCRNLDEHSRIQKKFVTKVILYYNFSSPYLCCNTSTAEEIWLWSQFRHCSIHYASRKAHFKVAK